MIMRVTCILLLARNALFDGAKRKKGQATSENPDDDSTTRTARRDFWRQRSHFLRFAPATILLVAISSCGPMGKPRASSNQDDNSKPTRTITGTMKDFKDHVIQDADVTILTNSASQIEDDPIAGKKKVWDTAYQTKTDADGRFSLTVSTEPYLALQAVKGYATENLEYWAWNLPANKDMTFDIHIQKLEVYGVHAWTVEEPGRRSVAAYFRPMSLSRLKTGLTPPLNLGSVGVNVDGAQSKVLRMDRIEEVVTATQHGNEPKMPTVGAYVIQFERSEDAKSKPVNEIKITITDSENGDQGEASYFLDNSYLNQ